MTDARFGIVVDHDNGRHVHFRLFAATGGAHLGSCGRLVMRADEFAAFSALIQPEVGQGFLTGIVTDDAPAPRLERVRTTDGMYRVLRQGVGVGALTFDAMVETLDADWLPVRDPRLGASASQIAAGVLGQHGEEALWRHLETLAHQLSRQPKEDSRG